MRELIVSIFVVAGILAGITLIGYGVFMLAFQWIEENRI